MKKCAQICLFCSFLGGIALAEERRAQILAGNQHFEAGDYAAALAAYDAAADQGALEPPAELLHNRAAALFKLGRLEEAREEWVRALSAGDARFEARTRYNLGNCAYEEALRWLGQSAASGRELTAPDPAGPAPAEEGTAPAPAASPITILDKAIEHYRDAIRLDGGLMDARANLELALKLKKELQQQETDQQQNQQPSSQPNQQQNPQSQPDQQNQPQSQPSDQNQNQNQNQEQQSQDQQQSQDSQSQSQDQSGQEGQESESEAEPGENGNENSNGSPEHDMANGNTNPQQPPSGQQQQQAGRNGNDNSSPEPAGSAGELPQPPPGVPIEMTPQQAERLLQLIRDREKARRAAIARREAARQRPVQKDW